MILDFNDILTYYKLMVSNSNFFKYVAAYNMEIAPVSPILFELILIILKRLLITLIYFF